MLYATTLSGNNAPIIADAIRSVAAWVDVLLLIDTGITDNSLEIARKLAGDKLRVVCYPWRNDFAAARNFSLQAAAEHGATWALTVDTDERMHFPGFQSREALINALNSDPGISTWMVPYNNVGYAKERFIRVPSALSWKGRTHEALIGAPGTARGLLRGCYFTELTKDQSQFRHKLERDLIILLEETKDKPTNARWWYYLGQTYEGLNQPREAVAAFERCAKLDGWDEEAAWACFKAAQCLNGLKEYKQALDFCTLGLARRPDFPELTWLAGFCCYQLGHFQKAIIWEQISAKMGNYEGDAIAEQRASFRYLPGWYEAPFDVMRWAYKKLGNTKAAERAEQKFQSAMKLRELKIQPPALPQVASLESKPISNSFSGDDSSHKDVPEKITIRLLKSEEGEAVTKVGMMPIQNSLVVETQFTRDWFTHNAPHWERWLQAYRGRENLRFLEIGAFEGRASRWLFENMLTHPSSTLTCCDLWPDNIAPGVISGAEVESRFDENLKPFVNRLEKIKGRSDESLAKLVSEKRSFDMVYVDGDHYGPEVLRDGILGFTVLKPGGILIFDDYGWKNPKLPVIPCDAIDAFIAVYAHEITIIEKGYQVAIRKNPTSA